MQLARLLVVLALLLAPGIAAAYPQFQLLHEERCSSCHIAPTGGGLINFYGRSEAGTTISRGGDGDFLHGAWKPPEWLEIGGDARFATGGKYVAERSHFYFFPMQSDLNIRAAKGEFAVTISAGLRGAGREPEPTYFESLWSREHYVSYETDELFMRAGRFYPVFGLRLADHTSYVRRHLGLYLQEEPYGIGISHFADKTELHVGAFVPPPDPVLGAGYQPGGATALVEHRFTDAFILGAQGRVLASGPETRYLVGGLAKWKLADNTLLLAELDGQVQNFQRPGTGDARVQVAAYAGVSRWLTKGLLLTPALHFWDPDVALAATRRFAADVHLQFFPRAHWELHLTLRAQHQGIVTDDGYLALLQGHYYL